MKKIITSILILSYLFTEAQINVVIPGTGGSGGSYTLPVSSPSILGGVKVGSGLAIDGTGVLSAPVYENYKWAVLDSLSAEPGAPLVGDYLVGTSATGTYFSGKENKIAHWDGTTWTSNTATIGDLLYNSLTTKVSRWNGTNWSWVTTVINPNWWSTTDYNGNAGQFIKIGNVPSYGSFGTDGVSLGYQTWYDYPILGHVGSTAIGSTSQHHNTPSAYNNTSVGNYSLWYGLSGHDNVAVGVQAGSGGSNYSISLGTNAQGVNNEFNISDYTTKMHMRLEAGTGTPDSLVGVHLGQWKNYSVSGLGGGGGGGSFAKQEFTSSTSSTITVSNIYTAGSVDVYKNGIMLPSGEYTEATGTTITLTSARLNSDLIIIKYRY